MTVYEFIEPGESEFLHVFGAQRIAIPASTASFMVAIESDNRNKLKLSYDVIARSARIRWIKDSAVLVDLFSGAGESNRYRRQRHNHYLRRLGRSNVGINRRGVSHSNPRCIAVSLRTPWRREGSAVGVELRMTESLGDASTPDRAPSARRESTRAVSASVSVAPSRTARRSLAASSLHRLRSGNPYPRARTGIGASWATPVQLASAESTKSCSLGVSIDISNVAPLLSSVVDTAGASQHRARQGSAVPGSKSVQL